MYTYNLGKLFERVCHDNSTGTAIVLENTTITYQELSTRVQEVSNWLLSNSVSRGDVVAIFNNKSITSYCIMLACLKIGATYTNIDPASTGQRLQKMLNTCNPVMLFVYEEIQTNIDVSAIQVIDYVKDSLKCNDQYTYDEVPGDTIAYLMFTSGSTGFPKAVAISHSSIINFISWSRTTIRTTNHDRFTGVNPMHFDNSVFDFYSSLFTGASLAPVPTALLKNPRSVVKLLNKVAPTIWFSVPSMLVYMLKMRSIATDDIGTIRMFVFGGEGFPKTQLRQLWQMYRHQSTFLNVYGPTEGTCICSSYEVSDSDIHDDSLLPLGKIAPNFDYVILDDKSNVTSKGELCLIGDNLAKGYYNDNDRTKVSFQQNPRCTNIIQLMYRTGDIVSQDMDSVLHFHGRVDNQIKRMGHRIELEEIEVAIGSIPEVIESAVLYIDAEPTDSKIVAYVSKNNAVEVLPYLRKTLPYYMIPDEIIYVQMLPKNRSGKVDRLQLKKDYLK